MSASFSVIPHSTLPALGLVRGGALLLVAGGAFLLVGGLVSSLVHSPAFWCVTSLDLGGQGDTGDHKLKSEAVSEDQVRLDNVTDQLSVHVELESLLQTE